MTQTKQQRSGASAHAAIIDEYGELSRRVAEFKPTIDRHKKLKDEIESWYALKPAGEAFVEHGEAYSVQLSARAHERTIISMDRLYKRLGKTRFLEWATFPLSVIDKLFANPGEILKSERTGHRKVEAVARVAAKAA